MSNKLFAIAKITRASGLKGEVGVRPLVRQCYDYVMDISSFICFDATIARAEKLAKVTGLNLHTRYLTESL